MPSALPDLLYTLLSNPAWVTGPLPPQIAEAVRGKQMLSQCVHARAFVTRRASVCFLVSSSSSVHATATVC